MSNFDYPSSDPNYGGQLPQKALPNATAVLVLGIASIVTCCCYGIIGLICGIIAMILAGKDRSLYMSNPAAYTPSSYSNLKTGRILAIIGLVLSALYLVYSIFLISTIGISGLSDPEAMKEWLESLQNQR